MGGSASKSKDASKNFFSGLGKKPIPTTTTTQTNNKSCT